MSTTHPLLISGENPNHSFTYALGQAVLSFGITFGQSVLAFGQSVLASGQTVLASGQSVLASGQSVLASAYGSGIGKPKSISNNGKSGIQFQTKTNESESESDIKALMPKLRHSYYYTKPTIQEIAAKEQAEPGYCSRVKDFIVGRHGVGSIKFLGETDLRGLDLESFIKIHHDRFALAYALGKTPDGYRFNGKAEMMLVTTKFSRQEMIYGYGTQDLKLIATRLRKKVEDQGWEFVSYDPTTGEVKWRTKYFSRFGSILFLNNKYIFV